MAARKIRMPLPVASDSTFPASQMPVRRFQLFIASNNSADRRKSRLAPLEYIILKNGGGMASFPDGLPAGSKIYFQSFEQTPCQRLLQINTGS